MNVERLNQIAMWLEAGAPSTNGVDGFDMSDWKQKKDCGTVCCIAGTANEWWNKGKEFATSHDAAQLLGLTDEQREHLFLPGSKNECWAGIEAPPAWAARCIRKFIATGDVDWQGTRDAPAIVDDGRQIVSWESMKDLWQPVREGVQEGVCVTRS